MGKNMGLCLYIVGCRGNFTARGFSFRDPTKGIRLISSKINDGTSLKIRGMDNLWSIICVTLEHS